jgi:hypothetical protein
MVYTANRAPPLANALPGPVRQSQHLETEDNAGTALLYMQICHQSQGRKRTHDTVAGGSARTLKLFVLVALKIPK